MENRAGIVAMYESRFEHTRFSMESSFPFRFNCSSSSFLPFTFEWPTAVVIKVLSSDSTDVSSRDVHKRYMLNNSASNTALHRHSLSVRVRVRSIHDVEIFVCHFTIIADLLSIVKNIADHAILRTHTLLRHRINSI